MIVWYDLSPMRPDEYANTNAYRWHEATVLRDAYQSGYDDAKRERQSSEALMNMDMQA